MINKSALVVSESRFEGAFAAAAHGMAFVSLEGRWLRVNQALCDIVGYDEAQLLVTDFQTLTHPDDLNADLGFLEQLVQGEIPNYQMEKRYFHKNGHIVWILLAVSLVRDEAGTPVHFVSQIQDISKQKHATAQMELSMSVARLGILRWQLSDGSIVLDPHYATPLGYDGQTAIPPVRLEQFVHPSDLPILLAARDHYFNDELTNGLNSGSPLVAEIRVRDSLDSFSWVRLSAQREDPRSSVLLGVYSNITANKMAELKASNVQQRLSLLIASLPDVVLACDVAGDLTELHIPAAMSDHFINGTWQGRHYSDVLPRPLSEMLDAAIIAAWENPEPQLGRASVQVRGSEKHFGISVTRLADQRQWPTGFLVVLRDETDVRLAEQQLTHIAFHDVLTGLPNRRLFEDRLRQAREKSTRAGSYCALIMVDLDKFKALNDTHGHDAGDLFLQQVAQRLRDGLRGSDTVARLGGDEFIILLDDLGTERAAAEAHVAKVHAKLVSALHGEFDLGSVKHVGAASFGQTLFCGTSLDMEAIFKAADAAMYADKITRRASAEACSLGHGS